MKRRLLSLAMVGWMLMGFIPSAQALATLDSYISANFGRSYPVYSGPGTQYYRANMGKAMYGGGAARVYGIVDEWILIGYGLSNGDYRIGYISPAALNTMKAGGAGSLRSLYLGNDIAYADDYCRITDDPVMYNKMICTLPENTPVRVLATMGSDWTYVEANTSEGLMRGFVWSKHLKNYSPSTPPPVYQPVQPPVYQPVQQPVYQPPVMTNAPQLPVWITTPPQSTPAPRPTADVSGRPAMTAGDQAWLPTPQDIFVRGNWPVYSGPGEYYFRANNGKATKGESTCQVYGVENLGYGDWVLIGYSLTGGGYRVGYIRAEALDASLASVPALKLSYKARRLAANAALTDDPLRTLAPVANLSAGSYVLSLGSIAAGDELWMYVEVLAQNQVMRGFVPAAALE